jgi:type II secretory pathway predicted ATPase ExeA
VDRRREPADNASGIPCRHRAAPGEIPVVKPASPFAPNAGREGFFESAAVREALQRLSDAVGDREPFLLVTGEPGCGKTALVRESFARRGDDVRAAWVSLPARTETELVEEVVRRFGGDPPADASAPRLVACFEHALAEIAALGQLATIVVDDAHALEPPMLEQLRMLVNAAQRAGHRIEVLLAGLPSLEARLEEPALAALRQRVSVRCRLERLSVADTRRYLQHRVTAAGGDGPGLFERRACREIATQSRGLPREINALATEALRLARAAGHPAVCSEHVLAAATNLWGRVLPGSADSVAEPGPAAALPVEPAASPAPKRKHAPPPVAKAAPDVPRPVPASAPASAPPAASVREAPRESAPSAPPKPQDPREWVQRFIGDQGPVRIGSRAAAPANWGADDSEARVVPRLALAVRREESSATDPPASSLAPAPRESAPLEVAAHSEYALPAVPPRSRRLPVLVPALAALALVAAVLFLVRAGGTSRGTDARAARAEARSAPATGPAPVQSASPAPVVTPVAPDPDAAAGTSVAPAERASLEAPASATGASHTTLDVGSYIDPERAASERRRLRTATGLDAWVVRVAESGGETYHVVLGIYRSEERASSAADLLLAQGKVSQARVVPLPPRRARR